MKHQKSKIFEHIKNQRFQTKAQGMSINTIIIAIIVLIVLVVLVAIFTGKMGEWFAGTKDCNNLGGDCMNVCPSGYKEIKGTNCADKPATPNCCIKLSK